MSFKTSFIILCLSFIILGCSGKINNQKDLPNIVIFLVDDLGWADLSSYGSKYHQTPTIDNLANTGVKFTNAYSSCTVCSPTRASLMSGKYPARINLTDWIEGHKYPYNKFLPPDWTMFLDTAEVLLPELLREQGYFAAHIGKWHLGEDAVYWPDNQGFDINVGGWSVGRPVNGYFSPYKFPTLDDGKPEEYLTTRLTKEAVDIINRVENQPLFLNMNYYSVHTPLQAPKEDILKHKQRIIEGSKQKNPKYAAMLEHVDRSIAKIINALSETGKLENTYILFMSDNGGLKRSSTSNFPLREGKGTFYEGGTRVPMIVWGPGIVDGGKIETTPVITMDAFNTICALAKIKEPSNSDGINLVPLINQDGNIERDALYWHYPHYHSQGAVPYSAIRKGDWKLIHIIEDDHYELYNLQDDIGESINLAAQNPQKVLELRKYLNEWLISVNAQMPINNPNYDPSLVGKKKRKQKE